MFKISNLAKVTSITFMLATVLSLTFAPMTYAISASGLLPLINAQRTSAGISPLSINSQLQSSAYLKVQDMCNNNYWGHVSPSGKSMGSFVAAAGYSYSMIGENLANGYLTDSAVFSAWMASAGHRANMLNSGYKHLGIASKQCAVNGKSTTLTVAHFGAPLGSAKATTKPKPVSTTPTYTTITQKTQVNTVSQPTTKQSTAKVKPKTVRKLVVNTPLGKQIWDWTWVEYLQANGKLPSWLAKILANE